MDCYFCKQRIRSVDFKNVTQLNHFITSLGKIKSREKTGLCRYHQRKLAKAVKQARHLGLLSASTKQSVSL